MMTQMVMVSCDTDANTSGITWHVTLMLVLIVLIRLPKMHVVPHFNGLDLRKALVPLTTLVASHDARTGTIGDTSPKWHITPHIDNHNLMNVIVPLMVLSTSHDTGTNAMVSCDVNVDVSGITWQEVTLHLILIGLIQGIQCCLWWCCLHHVTLTPASLTLHDQKCYVAHCLNHLDRLITIVLLAMPLVSDDAATTANSVKWLKKSCCISFCTSWTSKSSGAIKGAIMQCQHWHHMTKKVMLQSSWPNKQNSAIDNAITVMWYLHWC